MPHAGDHWAGWCSTGRSSAVSLACSAMALMLWPSGVGACGHDAAPVKGNDPEEKTRSMTATLKSRSAETLNKPRRKRHWRFFVAVLGQ